MGTGQIQLFTQEVNEQRAWFDQCLDHLAIYLHGNL
jgi:hypothetical protein